MIEEKDAAVLAIEMQKSGKMQEWQLYVAILSLVVAIATLLIQNFNSALNENVTSAIIAILIVISILSILVNLYRSSSSDSEKHSWYGRITALENLRRSTLNIGKPLKNSMLRMYISGLRTNYQFALLEGRKELADYLKEQIAEHEKMIE
jgi:uncharacterized membrane protein